MVDAYPPDLLAATAQLMEIPSVSHEEGRLADAVERRLRKVPGLLVERVEDNVVARTELGRPARLLLAGHLDTVPPNNNAEPRVEGEVLHGLGATDMKGGLAVMLELAEVVPEPTVDVTWVFYSGEEVADVHNGLGHLFRDRPDLVAADAAVLGEPTDAAIEAGCQGTLRLQVELAGARAHTARAWMGRNAIHRAGELLSRLDRYEPRQPVLDGCAFHEGMQVVAIEGGVAGNVVPDRVTVTINMRFAPDRTADEAEAEARSLLEGILEPGDECRTVDLGDAAPPSLDHPLLRTLCERSGLPVRAKLGWTDVARFAGAGIPAVNFGPGEARLAHSADEKVEKASLEATYLALKDLLESGVPAG